MLRGDFLKSITPYCKKAIGMEIKADKFRMAKREVGSISSKYFNNPPEADVYFLWIGAKIDLEICSFLLKSIDKDITILVNRRKENEWSLGIDFGESDKYLLDLFSEVIYIPL